MRYLIMVKSTPAFEAEGATPGGFQPDPTVFAEMAAFHEELARAGMLLDASGLKPSRAGWRVRYDGERRTVIDGPFTEAKELIAGFFSARLYRPGRGHRHRPGLSRRSVRQCRSAGVRAVFCPLKQSAACRPARQREDAR